MDAADFDALPVSSMQWHGQGWHDQPDRFAPHKGDDPIDWGMRLVYWFADAPAMILARAYLQARGERFQVLTDEAPDAPFLIITDYPGSAWGPARPERSPSHDD
jgi:hypothetical protein